MPLKPSAWRCHGAAADTVPPVPRCHCPHLLTRICWSSHECNSSAICFIPTHNFGKSEHRLQWSHLVHYSITAISTENQSPIMSVSTPKCGAHTGPTVAHLSPLVPSSAAHYGIFFFCEKYGNLSQISWIQRWSAVLIFWTNFQERESLVRKLKFRTAAAARMWGTQSIVLKHSPFS